MVAVIGPRFSIRERNVAVRQRLHKFDKRIFLVLAQSEITELSRVQVFGGLGHRPAGDFLAGIIGSAAGQDIARIVEIRSLETAPMWKRTGLSPRGTRSRRA